MKAVIVEDDALVGDAVRRALHRAGFDAEHVSTGGAGLDALAARPFDLAVVDIDLPDVDGLSVVRELRRRGLSLPAVILSAHDSIAQRQRAFAVGASDYLGKPFEVAELIVRCRAQVVRSTLFPPELSICHRRMLERLSRDCGQIVSSAHLAQAGCCAPAEVDAQIASLRDKLAPPVRIRQIRGLGYRID